MVFDHLLLAPGRYMVTATASQSNGVPADQILKQQLKKQLKNQVAPYIFGAKVAGGTLLGGAGLGVLGAGLLYKTGKIGWDIGATAHKSKKFLTQRQTSLSLCGQRWG